MSGLRVLVCGGRTFEDRKVLNRVLSALHAEQPFACVIEGDARGADWLASAWARHNGVCNIKVPPHWSQLGKRAGHVRNGWMLEHCSPDVVVAFPGGAGTANMVQQAHAAGVQVIDHRTDASAA